MLDVMDIKLFPKQHILEAPVYNVVSLIRGKITISMSTESTTHR